MREFSGFARAAAGLATGQLGWSPDDFWRSTVAELRMALAGRFGTAAAPLDGAELARLKERLPDER